MQFNSNLLTVRILHMFTNLATSCSSFFTGNVLRIFLKGPIWFNLFSVLCFKLFKHLMELGCVLCRLQLHKDPDMVSRMLVEQKLQMHFQAVRAWIAIMVEIWCLFWLVHIKINTKLDYFSFHVAVKTGSWFTTRKFTHSHSAGCRFSTKGSCSVVSPVLHLPTDVSMVPPSH